MDNKIDQEAYDLRVNKGILPTIDIAGHIFYVDIRMDKLRPKDDFLSKGIVFHEIAHYFSEEANAYIIPYNSQKHEFQELDYDTILEIPKDLIAIQFPIQRDLDPIGWNRKIGWDIKEDLDYSGLKSHFKAKTIPWKETSLPEIIIYNLKVLKEKSNDEKLLSTAPAPKKTQQRKKRRKI